MKTIETEDGTFTTDGTTDESGNLVGMLKNHRGERRWVIPSGDATATDATPVDSAPQPIEVVEVPIVAASTIEDAKPKKFGRR